MIAAGEIHQRLEIVNGTGTVELVNVATMGNAIENDGHGTRAMTWRGVEIGIPGKIGMPTVMVNGIVIKHGIVGTIGIVAVIEGAGVDHHVRVKTDEWKERERER